ncbi:MAG: QueT transporter family protein [Candidatus Odinarchaeia archaeon]
MNAKNLTVTVFCAATYAALMYFLAPISFMQIQVRVANALIGVVPLLGMPAVYGITLGVLIGNTLSPLGPIDLLSAIPSFIGLLIVYKLRKKSVLLGLTIYSLIISIWVAFMLNYVFNLPYLLTFAYVFIGVTIATVGLGYLLYICLLKRNILNKWVGD